MAKLCVGIESTAHTFGAAVVSFDGVILSNARDMYKTVSGGMVPHEVAKHHVAVGDAVVARALSEAGVSSSDISLVSFAAGPGLPPCLRVGKELARKYASLWGVPLIGINHCVAHLTIGQLVTKTRDPVYLYVSGVNTQVIALAGDRFRIFGETLDIGLGNALDKFGREAGLGFPAAPQMEKLAVGGRYVELPYAVKGMDVSFSGIVTKAVRLLGEGKASVQDLCFSLQETTFAMLAEVCERALAHCEKSELILIGGVAANRRLCEMLTKMCEARGARFYPVPMEYCGDQGAMIAWQGVLEFVAGRADDAAAVDIRPYERTDDVPVTWV